MSQQKIPWWQPQVEKEDYTFIKKALDNNFVNEGPLVVEFQKEISQLLKIPCAMATTSGTVALFLALKACGVKRNDEVILPDISFIAAANAVDLLGATPVFVDIDPDRLTMSPSALEHAITKQTTAIVPVHVSGRAPDMRAIMKIAKKYKLRVIEDAAEALMSKQNGKFLGTLGDAGCFSFSANKTISTGQGGMIVTHSRKIYDSLRALRNQGIATRGTGGDDIHPTIGYNFRMTDLQAGVGLGQLKHFAARIKRMRRNYDLYAKHLKGVGDIRVFPFTKEEVPQWTDIETGKRNELEAYLREKNIDSRRFWHPVHRQKPYKKSDTGLSRSTRMSPRALWLPSAFTLTDKDVMQVVKEIKTFYSHI
jgi:perosamine synthetase